MNLMQGTVNGWQLISPRKLAPMLFLAAVALGEALWIHAIRLPFPAPSRCSGRL
jgi:hypothetical protein